MNLLGKKLYFSSVGFTFVEVMITIAILSTGLLFINNSILRFITGSQYLYRRSYAQDFLNNKIWELENEFRQSDDIGSLQREGSITSGGREYNWKVSFTPADSNNQLYQAILEARWFETVGREASLEYLAYIHK